MEGQQGALPQVAPLGLTEEERGVDRHAHGQRQPRPEQETAQRGRVVRLHPADARAGFDEPPEPRHQREADQQERAAGEPTLPLGAGQDVEETLGTLQVVDQQRGGDADEEERQEAQLHGGAGRKGEETQAQAEAQQHEDARADAFGDQVGGHGPVPRHQVLRIVRHLHHLLGHASRTDLDGTGGGVTLGLGRADGCTRRRTFRGGDRRRVGCCTHGDAQRLQRDVPVAIGGRRVQRNHVGPQVRFRRARRGGGMECNVIAVDVEKLGRGTLLRLAHGDFLRRQQIADLRRGIVHVARDDGVLGADDHASRFQPQIGAMGAKVTFGCGVGTGIDVNGVIGAGLHARLAADATGRIKFNDAVGALVHGRHRTDTHARRVGAVVAAGHLEVASDIGIGAGLHVLDPRAIDAQWHLVLRLAGGGAGVTANALAVVDDKTVVHEPLFTWLVGTKGAAQRMDAAARTMGGV